MKKDIIAWFLLFGIILFSISCKPQKFVNEYKGITKVDTFNRIQLRTVYRAVNDTTIIESPCDSTGILNEFYTKISIPFGQVVAKGRGNRITLSVKTDSLLSSVDSTYKSKASETISIKEKEVIKYRIPSWIIYTLIIETLLIALYVYLRVKKFIL